MAIDTHTKRRSVLGAFMVALTVLPVPDSTVGTQDRPHAAGLYAGITIAATATVVLFPPSIVDAPPRRWKVDAEREWKADAPERNWKLDDEL